MHRFSLIFAAAFISLSAAAIDEVPEKILKRGMDATVRIISENGSGQRLGSGFLVKSSGNTGLVVTNAHVVNTDIATTNVYASVRFRSGAAQTNEVQGQIISVDSARDLAILKVEMKDLPKPLSLKFDASPRHEAYVFGFPSISGHVLPNCFRRVIGGAVDDEGLEYLRIWGAAFPGNSGGAVLDGDGNAIGICARGSTDESWAIPAQAIQNLLARRIYRSTLSEWESSNGKSTILISVPLDGFDTPTAVEIIATPVAVINASSGVRITSREEGTLHWPPVVRQALEIRDHVARGTLDFTGDGRTNAEFILSVSVAENDGALKRAGFIPYTVEFSHGESDTETRKKRKHH